MPRDLRPEYKDEIDAIISKYDDQPEIQKDIYIVLSKQLAMAILTRPIMMIKEVPE